MFKIFFTVAVICSPAFTVDINEELEALSSIDLVKYASLHGMHLKAYKVLTSDSWLLEVHRVRNMVIFDKRYSTPVFISHGFASSSFEFMLNPRNESIAFILADHGFDVWIVNYRANRFSNLKMQQGKLSPPKPKDYYKASWQYMAERDVPATLDFILEQTKQSKVFVVGQSMGTTVMYAFLSENHNYDSKISHFAAIAPVLKFAKEDNSSALFQSMNQAQKVVDFLFWPNFNAVFGCQLSSSNGSFTSSMMSFSESSVCSRVPKLCEMMRTLQFDRDELSSLRTNPHFNMSRSAVYSSMYPSGTSMMNGYNFAIQATNEPWSKIDFSKIWQTGFINQKEYGSRTAPKYNFSTVNVEVSMFFVKNDVFTHVDTAKTIIKDFGPSFVKLIEGQRFSHQDTLTGWDARCYIYDDIVARFNDIDCLRDENRKRYRFENVQQHIDSLPFENGCLA